MGYDEKCSIRIVADYYNFRLFIAANADADLHALTGMGYQL